MKYIPNCYVRSKFILNNILNKNNNLKREQIHNVDNKTLVNKEVAKSLLLQIKSILKNNGIFRWTYSDGNYINIKYIKIEINKYINDELKNNIESLYPNVIQVKRDKGLMQDSSWEYTAIFIYYK